MKQLTSGRIRREIATTSAGCRFRVPRGVERILLVFSTREAGVIAGLLLAGLCAGSGLAQGINLDTDYRNIWLNTTNLQFSPYSNYFGVWPEEALTNASTTVYGGSVYNNTKSPDPILPTCKDKSYGLLQSAFGQPVVGIQPDFVLGQVITPPRGVDTNQPPANFKAAKAGNNTNAFYEIEGGGAFWSPSTLRVIAAQPNNIQIDWIMLDGSTNTQVLNIGAVPAKRPAKLFWTESPYDSPPVNMHGLFPVIHYNSEVPPPTFQVTTNGTGDNASLQTNLISGVWLDPASKQLRAIDVSGMFIVEYYQEGTYSQAVVPDSIEVVQALAPDVQVRTASIGDRLLPQDLYWAELEGQNGVIPNVTRGINDTVFVATQDGPKKNWAYAINETTMEPWAAEIYWQQAGVMDVQWPYEVDWYFMDWPVHPQLLVLGSSSTDQATVLIPDGLGVELMPEMDPPLHASLSGTGKSISTTEPGRCLVKYTTANDIWFEVIQTVSYTNSAYFDLEPKEWPIGTELTPGDPEEHALQFNGVDGEAVIGTSFLNRLEDWTVSLWFSAQDFRGATLFSEGTDTNETFSVVLTSAGQIEVSTRNQDASPGWNTVVTLDAPVLSNKWHYLTLVYHDGSETNGTLEVYLDNYLFTTSGLPRVSFFGDDQAVLGTACGAPGTSDWYLGKLDELRIWNQALDSDTITSNRSASLPLPDDSVIANFPCDEGQGFIINNLAGDRSGTLSESVVWSYGQAVPDAKWNGYPGFIHLANGLPDNDRYNINLYRYPTESTQDETNSYVFAVNTGSLEVWWSNLSRQEGMPPVYYASRVVNYSNVWPSDPREIVIASGLGSNGEQPVGVDPWDPVQAVNPSIYFQNNNAFEGYNPNEEHALLLGSVIYALRNDLNRADSSEPFVLVEYSDGTTGRPRMEPFKVLKENTSYNFERSLTAGLPILPPEPLASLPSARASTTDTNLPAWRDRKLTWWAVAAGNDGGMADARMRFWYQVQETFYFPALTAAGQPVVGTEVPWLPFPSLGGGTNGLPVAVTYHISWPTNSPKLHLGQTLTTPVNGLPDIWNQLSVEIPYQQSWFTTANDSAVLFDPVQDRAVPLDSAVIDQMIAAGVARKETTSQLIRFPNLPPSLYPRIFYDPDRSTGQLVIEGQMVTPLTGPSYLLLNMLEDYEVQQLIDVASGLDGATQIAWTGAILGPPGMPVSILPIQPNIPYVRSALGARLSEGSGYLTLVFNNSTNQLQVPEASPVSVNIIQVDTNLYSGVLEVIAPSDVLAEQLSLRIGADFSGFAEDCEFRWRYAIPVGGLPPDVDFISTNWLVYGDTDTILGANEVTIEGASPFTLADHYFAVQYRPLDTNGPSGEAWSDWTYQLAPGWVVRAMTGINPFMQVYQDTLDHAVDTRATMIQEAGGPYEGDVALNLDAASAAGLIPTYETIFHRAKEFSVLAGLSDPAINETLLFAAGRLRDLYMLLGNEAFADAQDPTIAFPDDLSVGSVGEQATSIFPFMNQVPNQLEEELALLRGRDDTLEPSVQTSPVYNRLIWNFTAGIDGGEPAYAYNYNIVGNASNTTGVINAEDAKRLYPQGHGDAWGYFLSAIGKYYELLAYTNFMWQTVPGATLIGSSATVSTDFLDEQKFAETAASRARVGAEIVRQTFRQHYSEDPTGRWPGYHDSNTNRAWGIAGWSSRAGQAAFYDWAAVNSLMWDTLTNLTQVAGPDQPPEGIQRIDRSTTLELNEISVSYRTIQSVVDSADGDLNPLGLARTAVPFDIDPAAADAGETHFEQVYARALQAVYNACLAFNHARGVKLALNQQFQSLHDQAEALSASETDYESRLVDIYGYPYSDDIGPAGNYPQGYDGPDLLDWQYIDMKNLVANPPTGTNVQIQVTNLFWFVNNPFRGTDPEDYENLPFESFFAKGDVGTIEISLADNGLKVKPATWTGQRRAQGELQLAMSEYIQAWYALLAKKESYDQTLAELETEIRHRQAEYVRYPDEWAKDEANIDDIKTTANTIAALKVIKASNEYGIAQAKELGLLFAKILPKETEGLTGPLPIEELEGELGAGIRAITVFTSWASKWGAFSIEIEEYGTDAAREKNQANFESLINGNQYQFLLQWNTADTMVKLRDQYVKQAELLAQVEKLSQMQQRIFNLLGEGERLLFERGQVRSRAAQRLQMGRYADISFRIYRDDALRRYQSAFELAARYTYLAAKAYDYETGLLSTDHSTTPGSRFLEDVVRARLPGRFFTWLGEPMVGGPTGEPGLADILARMNADWDVVKGRFGFNNPETETSRFSLRTELFRTSPGVSGDTIWMQLLENSKVPDLNQLTEFRRYCRPFSAPTNTEPGLVISFPSYVMAGRNFFGFELAGGDNAYDASHAATKIRSVGVWFTGYNNTNGALANEPRVYLVPVGMDVLRSPTGDATSTRSYTIFDQAIPLPYNVGGMDIDDPDWSPVVDSLQEPFGQLRQFASFRAYHDSGDFDPSETITASRLIGRSVWNTQWLLIIPGRTLLNDPEEGVERFIYGPLVNGKRTGAGVKDIKIFFQTYSISGD